jgi:hypothetical protein
MLFNNPEHSAQALEMNLPMPMVQDRLKDLPARLDRLRA